MCTKSGRMRLLAWATCGAFLLGLATPTLAEGVKEYKFEHQDKSGKKRTAKDLHIDWDGSSVSWDGDGPTQDPAGTFSDHQGNGKSKTSHAAGETGTGVADGASVVIKFKYPGNTAPKADPTWTYDNKLCAMAGSGDPMISVTLASVWSGGQAAGDGALCVIVDRQEYIFQTARGDWPEMTAQRFGQFIDSLPFGLTISVDNDDAEVVFTGLAYSNEVSNIVCQVIRGDSRQQVQIREVPSVECPGDVDGDGAVGQSDLARVLAAYNTQCSEDGQSGYDAEADLDGDLTVGQSDLATVLAHYGERC